MNRRAFILIDFTRSLNSLISYVLQKEIGSGPHETASVRNRGSRLGAVGSRLYLNQYRQLIFFTCIQETSREKLAAPVPK